MPPHFTTSKIAITKIKLQALQGFKEIKTLIHCWPECKNGATNVEKI